MRVASDSAESRNPMSQAGVAFRILARTPAAVGVTAGGVLPRVGLELFQGAPGSHHLPAHQVAKPALRVLD